MLHMPGRNELIGCFEPKGVLLSDAKDALQEERGVALCLVFSLTSSRSSNPRPTGMPFAPNTGYYVS